MTRDDIIRMALEAQAYRSSFDRWTMYDSDIERFAALVAAAEREACASIVEEANKSIDWTFKDCAAAIRARGAAPEDKA